MPVQANASLSHEQVADALAKEEARARDEEKLAEASKKRRKAAESQVEKKKDYRFG